MKRLPLLERKRAFRFQVVAQSPFAVDPDAFRLDIVLDRAGELAVAVPMLVIDDCKTEAERERSRESNFLPAPAHALRGQDRDGKRDRQ